jgi:hypothetical protein
MANKTSAIVANAKDAAASASAPTGSSANAAHGVGIGGGSEGQDWPKIAKGEWQMTSLVSMGAQKPKKSTEKAHACTDPSWLFAGYWGPGIVEQGGCQFSSWRISDNHYKIASICMVRRVGAAHLTGTVVVENADNFQMEAELVEGTKHIRIVQTGHRISDCSQ